MSIKYRQVGLSEVERLAATGATMKVIAAAVGLNETAFKRMLQRDQKLRDSYAGARIAAGLPVRRTRAELDAEASFRPISPGSAPGSAGILPASSAEGATPLTKFDWCMRFHRKNRDDVLNAVTQHHRTYGEIMGATNLGYDEVVFVTTALMALRKLIARSDAYGTRRFYLPEPVSTGCGQDAHAPREAA